MRNALLSHAPLVLLLGGQHIFEEMPRGTSSSHVGFAEAETRDWSTATEGA